MKFAIPAGEAHRFDAVCAVARDGDIIELEDGGEYPTAGAWAFPVPHYTLQPGVTLKAGTARIVLRDPVTSVNGVIRPDKDLFILRAGGGVTIIGGIWDANAAGNPGWFCSGMRFHGRFTVDGSTIKGLRGSRSSGTPSGAVEVFAISSEGSTGGSLVKGVAVVDCEVKDRDSYVSGIFLGGTIPTSNQSIVKDCLVDLGEFGQFAYAANYQTKISGCIGKAARGFYNDTGDTIGCRMVGCKIDASYAGASMVSGLTPSERQLLITDCEIRSPRMIEWWECSEGPQMTGGIVVDRSKFTGNMLASTMSPRGTIAFTNIDWTNATPEHPFVVQGDGAAPLWIR